MSSLWRYYRVACGGNEIFVKAASSSHSKEIVRSVIRSNDKWGYPLSSVEWDMTQDEPTDWDKSKREDLGWTSVGKIPTGTSIQ